MSAANWMPELASCAGGTNLFGEPGKHSGYFGFEELAAADPDVIAILPCGFDIERSCREMPLLAAHPEWPGLAAVKNGRVFVTDGNQYFNRPGPRVVESAEILAEILHPDEFDFGHYGDRMDTLGRIGTDRMSKTRDLLRGFAYGLILYSSPTGLATAQDASAPVRLPTTEQVTVTASRYQEQTVRVPANVTVITEEEIAASTAVDIPSLLRTLVNVQVTDITGNRRHYSVDLRGFGGNGRKQYSGAGGWPESESARLPQQSTGSRSRWTGSSGSSSLAGDGEAFSTETTPEPE